MRTRSYGHTVNDHSIRNDIVIIQLEVIDAMSVKSESAQAFKSSRRRTFFA